MPNPDMLRHEIRAAMSDLRREEGGLYAHFVFSGAFPGFRGHFPDDPILPGVCTIQAVLVMLESEAGRPVRLDRVQRAKFHATVSPGDAVDITCRVRPGAGDMDDVRATVTRAGNRVAELALRTTRETGEKT